LAPGSLVSTAALVFVGNVVARALAFLFPLVLTRAMGRDDFAAVYFFISTGFFASQLVMTGYPTAMTRFVASGGAVDEKGAWVVSGMLAGLPLLLVSIVFGEALARVADARSFLMTVIILGVSIDAYYFSLLRGVQRFRLLAVYRVAANLTQIILVLLAMATGSVTITLAVTIYGLVYLIPIAAIEATIGPLAKLVRVARPPSFNRIVVLTRFAAPSLVSGAAWGAIFGLDVFFVRVLAPQALADYSAARVLAIPMLLIPFAIDVVLLPRVAAATESERMRLLRQALAVAGAAAVIAVVAYAALGPVLVEFLLPTAYRGAADSVVVLAPALALLGLYSILNDWWMGLGKPMAPASSLVAGALVAAAMHFLITSRYGAVGAALAVGSGALAAMVVLGSQTARLARQPGREPTVEAT
jgi:O-antigen/teichoic acid export membrane protein